MGNVVYKGNSGRWSSQHEHGQKNILFHPFLTAPDLGHSWFCFGRDRGSRAFCRCATSLNERGPRPLVAWCWAVFVVLTAVNVDLSLESTFALAPMLAIGAAFQWLPLTGLAGDRG